MNAPEMSENMRLHACISRVRGGGLAIDPAWRPDTLP
jgi:hypothetical protein